jgi:hypothetical protein
VLHLGAQRDRVVGHQVVARLLELAGLAQRHAVLADPDIRPEPLGRRRSGQVREVVRRRHHDVAAASARHCRYGAAQDNGSRARRRVG